MLEGPEHLRAAAASAPCLNGGAKTIRFGRKQALGVNEEYNFNWVLDVMARFLKNYELLRRKVIYQMQMTDSKI